MVTRGERSWLEHLARPDVRLLLFQPRQFDAPHRSRSRTVTSRRAPVSHRLPGSLPKPWDLPSRVLSLHPQSVKDLPVGVEHRTLGGRQVRLDLLVQRGEVVIRHGREHVVLDVVIHVQVEKAEHRVDVHGSGVQPVVEHVLSQAGVLGDGEEERQPGAIEGWQTNEKERHDRPHRDRGGDHPGEQGEEDTASHTTRRN